MNIQVNPSQLVETSNEIKSLKDSLINTMEEIELLVLSVNGNWQGDAERAFQKKSFMLRISFHQFLLSLMIILICLNLLLLGTNSKNLI